MSGFFITDSVNSVVLEPELGAFEYLDPLVLNKNRSSIGISYDYKWGQEYRKKLKASFVNSADALQINSWWGAKVGLSWGWIDDVASVSSGFILGDIKPCRQFVDPTRVFRNIELELGGEAYPIVESGPSWTCSETADHCWAHNETSGTVLNDSNGAIDGVLTGDTTDRLGIDSGENVGTGIQYESGVLYSLLDSVPEGSGGTFDAVINIPGGSLVRIFEKHSTSGGVTFYFRISIESNNKVKVQAFYNYGEGIDFAQSTTVNAINTDEVVYIAVASTGTAWRINVNGVDQAITSSKGDGFIGADYGDWLDEQGTASYLARIGYLSTVKIYAASFYPTELSEATMLEHYNLAVAA